jgi:sulfur-oxidizing protein SoxY
MADMTRRLLLKGTLAGGIVGLAVSAGLLTPRTVLAEWPASAFEAPSIDEALKALFGGGEITDSPELTLKAPDTADLGTQVQVEVETKLANVSSLCILADANRFPLTALYTLSPQVEGYISMRVKLNKTSNVLAIVKADGKLYRASKSVQVTQGGCVS